MRSIALLGSTGSIGLSTLDLVRRFPDRFRIFGMVAGENLKLLAAQIKEVAPQCVAIKNESDVPRLRKLLGKKSTDIGWGVKGARDVSTANGVDVVLAAIVGAAGLVPTLEAIRTGKEVALANKEALVMAGEILVNEAKKAKSRLFPVDSEHSAIFQCLEGNQRDEVDKLILTASGGPFLKTPLNRLAHVTISQALKSPSIRRR
jgi:1-deoxy-D-xylulose-5-phosphate reductoisomerase